MVDSTPRSLETVDVYLDVLAHTYCRRVLQYFRCSSTEVATTDNLAHFIYEHGQQDRDVTGIAIHLHHVTLPRLADAGLIDYDPCSTTVRYHGQSSLENWLAQVEEHGEPDATA